jgi:hypothetical protein
MARLRILGALALAVMVSAPDAMAQRRGGGGAVSSGMRGAMVGGMVGGSSGAQKGARAGAVVGATRGVAQRSADRRGMDTETQSRTQYESSAAYQNAQHSDFYQEAPEEIITSAAEPSATSSATPAAEATSSGEEAIIRKDGQPIVGITYPADWRQKTGKNWISAISPKRNAWSVIATLDGAKDKEAGIQKVKQGLDKYLQNVEYDKITKTERGALLITGTGNGKKTNIPVVFAVGVFEAGPGQLAGTAFVVDKNAEDYYKEAVRYMCQTIRGQSDFTEQRHEAAKPVLNN